MSFHSTAHRSSSVFAYHGDRRISFLIGLAIFVALVLVLPRDVGLYDEGIVLSDAMRILTGDIPHRDFYANYGPAQYYIVSTVLKLSGGSFLAIRFYDIAVKALVCGLLFHITQDVCGRGIALLLTAISALWFVAFSKYSLYSVYPCMFFGLVASALSVPVSTGRGGGGAVAAAGACAGFAAVFRYEVGFFLLVANLLGAAMLVWLDQTPGAAIRSCIKLVTIYVCGTALVFVPVAAAYLVAAPIGPFWHDIIDYPTKYYGEMRRLPYPKPWTSEAGGVYFTPFTVGLALIEIVRMSWSGRRLDPSSRDARLRGYLVLFGLCSLLFFLKGTVRVSALHMCLANVTALVTAGVLARRWLDGSPAGRVGVVLLILFTLGPAAYMGARELKKGLVAPDSLLLGYMAEQAGFRYGGADNDCRTTPRSPIARYPPDYVRVANYVARWTRPDERIFVALDRHDKIFINSVALYFATGRLPGTHWHQFDPGLQTRADVQAAIITDLRTNRVRWVIRDASFDDTNEPNGSAKSSGVKLLDQFLDAEYRPVASSGMISIWLLKPETPAPSGGPTTCEASAID